MEFALSSYSPKKFSYSHLDSQFDLDLNVQFTSDGMGFYIGKTTQNYKDIVKIKNNSILLTDFIPISNKLETEKDQRQFISSTSIYLDGVGFWSLSGIGILSTESELGGQFHPLMT